MDKFKFKEELTITELIKESPKASAYEKTLIQGRFKVGRFKVISLLNAKKTGVKNGCHTL